MIKYTDFVNEFKNVGVIYHFTTLKALFQLAMGRELKNVELKTFDFISHNGSISCTRNSCLSTSPQSPNIGAENGYIARIAIDGSAVSNKYKVSPVKGLKTNDPDVFDSKHNHNRIDGDESEELIQGRSKIFPLKDYVIQVDIMDNGDATLATDITDLKKLLHNTHIRINKVDSFKPIKNSHTNEAVIIEDIS